MKVIRVPKDSAPAGAKLKHTAYRIVRYEHLVQLFVNRKYVLVSPFAWEDPFEKLWSRLVFRDKAEHEELKRRVFGNCLTYQARSDAMWSIYSRNWLGVRLTIELDELQRQMQAAPELAVGQVWLGEVNYLKDIDLTRKAQALISTVNRPGADHSEAIAKAWLNKRGAFKHEDEIRVFFVLPKGKAAPATDAVYQFSVDPHQLVKSIHIDPRAPVEVFEALRRDIRATLGFKGSVRQSSLLRLPDKLQAMLPPP